MNKLKATVFGATGLVGKQLVDQLSKNENYEEIRLANRIEVTYDNDKINAKLIDFDTLEKYTCFFEVDHIFICLGTTMKKAVSKSAFRKVDFELPKRIAEIVHKQSQVRAVLMISSIGANVQSSNFYMKTKGEAEKALVEILGDRAYVLRPSILLGKRQEFRLGEELGKFLIKVLSFLIPQKYKGIYDYELALAMIKIAESLPEQKVFLSQELKKMQS